MSNIKIDNPQYLLALGEQMQHFQDLFGDFIENLRNAVKTTMDNLTRLTHIMEEKVKDVETEISSLYSSLSCCYDDEDGGYRDSIYQQIEQLENLKYRYQLHIEKIDKSKKNIDYQYRIQLKPNEEKLINYINKFPTAINALEEMHQLMKQYLSFSSLLVRTKLTGDHGGFSQNNDGGYNQNNNGNRFSPVTSMTDTNDFEEYEEVINAGNSRYLDKIRFGRLKSLNILTDMDLSNAELLAQQKSAKTIEFKIGDSDYELCMNSGYRISTNNNGEIIASKDLYSEIDLEGGLLKGGYFYKKDEHYNLD